MIATNPLPTACPVLPPGMGTLNIMMTNEKAAASARYGTCFVLRFVRSHLPAQYQIGIIMIQKGMYVFGPK
jgi:hypothetical protein